MTAREKDLDLAAGNCGFGRGNDIGRSPVFFGRPAPLAGFIPKGRKPVEKASNCIDKVLIWI